jgi:hypothetical protein
VKGQWLELSAAGCEVGLMLTFSGRTLLPEESRRACCAADALTSPVAGFFAFVFPFKRLVAHPV